MKNELLSTAYKEIEYLKTLEPSWETFEKMSILRNAILVLENSITIHSDEITDIIDELVGYYGEKRVIEKMKEILQDLKRDIDCIAPNISNCMISKLKKSFEQRSK